jgi:hypothetical protein
LRRTLLAADVNGDNDVGADILAAHLADELAYQRARPNASAATKRAKRAPKGLGPGAASDPGLSIEQRQLITELYRAFASDDELQARWPTLALAAVVTAPPSYKLPTTHQTNP